MGPGEHGPIQLDRFTDPIFSPKLSFIFIAYFICAHLRGASFGNQKQLETRNYKLSTKN